MRIEMYYWNLTTKNFEEYYSYGNVYINKEQLFYEDLTYKLTPRWKGKPTSVPTLVIPRWDKFKFKALHGIYTEFLSGTYHNQFCIQRGFIPKGETFNEFFTPMMYNLWKANSIEFEWPLEESLVKHLLKLSCDFLGELS